MMKKLLILCLGATVLFEACVKKKEQPVGTTHVRFVNAIRNSIVQDVYINSTLVYGGKLGTDNASPYINHDSGIFNIGIANTGTTDANLVYSYGTTPGEYSTVYFFQDFNGNLVSGGIKDDMNAPPAGKARVRFVNCNNWSQTSFTMDIVGGANLFHSLVFATASPYYNVDPGTKFVATAIKVPNPLTIDINPQAGKIYNVWLAADTLTNLQAHYFIQNDFN